MDEKIITNAKEYIKTLFAGNADGHDEKHTLRVLNNAQKIASSYPESDYLLISLSALLHDVDDHKLFHTENNENARSFLKDQGMSDEKIEEICRIINSVSFSKNKGKSPETIEGKIVQDADRLDALGAIGIARTFAYGGKNGRSLNDSVRHFYDKLLLLKDTMNTEEGRKLASERHAYLEDFLRELEQEL